MKRIAAFFQQEISRIVTRELKDPVFENLVISFPEIRVNRDLSVAIVMVSLLGNGSDTAKVVEALNRAEKVIRREISAVSDLRRTPRFEFREDHTIETASKIDKILDMLEIPPPEPEEPDVPGESEDKEN